MAPQGTPSLLEVDDAHVHYGAVKALRGVSLTVAQGEIVAVVGANGAGKSTLLWAIAGVVPLTSGAILFNQQPIRGQNPEGLSRQGLALVPEGRHVFSSLTVHDNLALSAGVARSGGLGKLWPSTMASRHFDHVFDRFPGLRRRLNTPAGKLSGGEQQQLALARALLGRPKLLLLDEPSFGLAPLVMDAVFRDLAALRDEGQTILLIEQNAAMAVELADRTYILRHGIVERAGTSAELATSVQMASVYLGGN